MLLQTCPRCGNMRRFKFDICAACRAREEKQNDLTHAEIEAILNKADERNWNLKPHWDRNASQESKNT